MPNDPEDNQEYTQEDENAWERAMYAMVQIMREHNVVSCSIDMAGRYEQYRATLANGFSDCRTITKRQ